MEVKIVPIAEDRELICGKVLMSLPQWFGIRSAREGYARFAARAPMLGAKVDEQIVGYAALSEHFGINCEIHSMGVEPSWHRRGIGRALINATIQWSAERGFKYVTVKTLSEKHKDQHYAKTRRFYLEMGFLPFEELPELWGADNPCLVLMRTIIE
jgi:GNAT superfamily N-acetyltransferase